MAIILTAKSIIMNKPLHVVKNMVLMFAFFTLSAEKCLPQDIKDAFCKSYFSLYKSQFLKTITTDCSEFFDSIFSIEYPKTIAQLREIVIKADKPIACAGAKYSMGGQTWVQDGIVVDTQHLNAITAFNPELKTITVQAGALWSDVQKFLHKYHLSILVMQSYNDFSVGGSVSVNVHGRDPHGQLIESIESLTVMIADGSLIKTSRTEHSDLFKAVIGGYGACGIIVDVTLKLEDNYKIKRVISTVPVKNFIQFFKKNIKSNPNIGLFNANLYGPGFDNVVNFAWYKTNDPLTMNQLFQQKKVKKKVLKSSFNSLLEYGVTEFSSAQKTRFLLDNKIIKNINHVVWRSYEMSHSVSSLAENSKNRTKILQEYFIPVDAFNDFVTSMKLIIQKHQVKVLNISIRYVPKNNESILTYAKEDCFAFVYYIAVDKITENYEQVRVWTQKLIQAALDCNGTYYLPYHLFASQEQFEQSYPSYLQLLDIKKEYDPDNKFQNSLTKKYFH